MRKFLVLVVAALSTSGIGQRLQLPDGINKPLTSDQIAIYRVVLARYFKKSNVNPLNVANQTTTIEDYDLFGCTSAIKRTVAKATDEVQALDQSVTSGFRTILVDPELQEAVAQWDQADSAIKKVMQHPDIREQLTIPAVHVRPTGMFTLTEIVFDKPHRRAIVAYRFDCGMLCGEGGTLVLTKVKKTWKVTAKCGDWIS